MKITGKRFKLTQAQSAIKRGPSGEIYQFIKGKEFGAINLRDEDWMELLCLDINGCFLTCTTSEVPTVVRSQAISLEDVLRREVVIPEPIPIKVTKTQEEIDAELALAKSEERMATLEAENLINLNLTNEYLTNDSLDTINKAITAIEAYLEEPSIELEYKISQIEKYIAEDTRKTLHSRVDELLDSLGKVKEEVDEKITEEIVEEILDEKEEEDENPEDWEVLDEDEETIEESEEEVHRVSREEE